MVISHVRIATPATMTRDAYRELCWGAGLPETEEGYGLLLGYDPRSGHPLAAVTPDVEYARLLGESGGVTVPGDKVCTIIRDWPNLDSGAASVWR